MSKVVPYFLTKGSVKFGEFLRTPFNINMLSTVDDNQIPVLFAGWSGKKVAGWIFEFKSKNCSIIFDAANMIQISDNRKTYTLTIERVKYLGEFIVLFHILNIDLYWSDWVEENLEPKDYLPEDEIENYYRTLLNDMEKGHELLTDTGGENGRVN